MTQAELENLLLLWGYAYGPLSSGAELSYYGNSSLSSIEQTRTIRQVTTMDRGGIGRRRTMGAAAGLLDQEGRAGVLLVPTWAAAPVRCAETRTSVAKVLGRGAPEFSPEVVRVERAAMDLLRTDRMLGQVLRAEYCTLGGQGEKSKRFNLRRGAYRERVAEARGWMWCRLAA